ncbi:hypothetical protein CA13_20090 [Planctomycetes bacterium CA13]|uniref:Uncharacterized protein n=1 Tax=Novipirellula herctigrandis TaxID=2527986 RepID=A0A5C5YZU7_9BACT|nr:hypothetical protein CA13_20090 [Planctomycetes bacterium CA13]
MRSPRIFTVNRSLAKQLARGVHVGGQFAFVDLNAIDQDKVEFASDLHPAFSGVGANADKGQTRLTIPIPHREKLGETRECREFRTRGRPRSPHHAPRRLSKPRAREPGETPPNSV